MESFLSRIQRLEIKSAVEWSQSQLVSRGQNLSQPWDRVSRNSYPAAVTRVSRGIESAVTCIQPPELETAVNRIQPPEPEIAAG